jgi:hypothetical protein
MHKTENQITFSKIALNKFAVAGVQKEDSIEKARGQYADNQ